MNSRQKFLLGVATGVVAALARAARRAADAPSISPDGLW